MPIAQCMQCGDGICERHAKWHEDGYLCSKCAQKIGWKEYGAPERRIALPERHWESLEKYPPEGIDQSPNGELSSEDELQ